MPAMAKILRIYKSLLQCITLPAISTLKIRSKNRGKIDIVDNR